MRFFVHRRRFADLSEQEILALAISSEEDDARIYSGFAQQLRAEYPDSAALFADMADEEDAHRQQLIALHETRFGAFIPLIRREHVAGFYARQPIWLMANLGIEKIRAEAEAMERKAEDFYRKAAARSSDAASRKLLGDLAASEARHKARAEGLSENLTSSGAAQEEGFQAKRQFILTWVQPGLAGLMDGSVSTLAPIFATAFATQNSHTTFLVGLAAALGAGFQWLLPKPLRMMGHYRGAAHL